LRLLTVHGSRYTWSMAILPAADLLFLVFATRFYITPTAKPPSARRRIVSQFEL
jgi:hypothetical protein